MGETRTDESQKQPRRDEPPRHRDESQDQRHDEPKHTGPQVPGINPQPEGGKPLQPPTPTEQPKRA